MHNSKHLIHVYSHGAKGNPQRSGTAAILGNIVCWLSTSKCKLYCSPVIVVWKLIKVNLMLLVACSAIISEGFWVYPSFITILRVFLLVSNLIEKRRHRAGGMDFVMPGPLIKLRSEAYTLSADEARRKAALDMIGALTVYHIGWWPPHVRLYRANTSSQLDCEGCSLRRIAM